MITARTLIYANNCFRKGQILQVYNPKGTEKKELETVKIVEKYPYFILVSNGRYKWAVNYQDILDKIS